MPGAVAYGCHEGSRSEYLAQYVFGSWGTAVAIPHQEDHGIDLTCTLMEQAGKRYLARSPYTVQVKSIMDPVVFEGEEEVRWLIEHPLPFYLCVVEKAAARLSVYHTFPRFEVWSWGRLPPRVELVPVPYVPGETGRGIGMAENFRFTLGTPILHFSITEMLDNTFSQNAKWVFQHWVEFENDNLTRIRTGLLRYRIPTGYRTNEWDGSWFGLSQPNLDERHHPRANPLLRECLEWIGGQLHTRGDTYGATCVALLHRHLFAGDPEDANISLIRSELNCILGCGGIDDQGIHRLGRILAEALAAPPP